MRRIRAQPAGTTHSQIIAAPLQIGIDRLRGSRALEVFLEALQHPLVDPLHHRRAAIEALHQLLDAERIGIIPFVESRRQGLLVIEAQPFLASAGDQMQAEAQA